MLVGRVILLTTFDSANMDPVAFTIALLTLHVVTIADLLAIWGVSNQLQLGARQIASLALVLSFLTFALSFVALGWVLLPLGRLGRSLHGSKGDR